MEPRDYVVAVCRRWVWVVAAAVAGACCAVFVASSAAPSYTSSTTMYVSVSRVQTAEALASSARVQAEVLPSLVLLARSPAVLQPVADELDLRVTATALADQVGVTVSEGTSLLSVSVSAPDGRSARQLAEAVGQHLQEQSGSLYVDVEGDPLLSLVVTTPPREPQVASSPNIRRAATLGLLGGVGAAVLLGGLWELARPRVRNADDVAALTSVPVLAGLADGTEVETPRMASRAEPTGPSRGESLRWLAWTLGSAGGSPGPGTIGLLGPRSAALVSELQRAVPHQAGAPGDLQGATPDGGSAPHLPALHAIADGRRLRGQQASLDALVLVVDVRTAGVRELRAGLATAADSGLPLGGIVLDRVPPPRATVWQRIRAALRGDALLGSSVRKALVGPGTAGRSPRWTAVAALFAVGLDHRLPSQLDTAFVVVVALLPVWLSALRRYRGAVALAWSTVAVILTGALLAFRASPAHAWSLSATESTTVHILGALGTIGLLLWARGHLSLPSIGVAYGLGQLVHGLLAAPASDNAFKFELSLPLTIVVLSLAAASRRPALTVAALVAMGLLDIANDARSAFGFCVVAAALVVWQARPRWSARRTRPLVTIALLVVMAAGGYSAVTEALVSGALGPEVQNRTVTQISQSGSLLLGGRPEWTATWALMQEDPFGHGLGTVPTGADVVVAKAGIAVANIPTAEGYVEHYMFNGAFELHSVTADLWSNAGPVGLLLGLTMAGLLVRALVDAMGQRVVAVGLVSFLVLRSLWMLAFGPLSANLPDVAFTLGIVLALRSPTERTTSVDPAESVALPAPQQAAAVPGSSDAPVVRA